MTYGFVILLGTLAITRYNYAILPSYKSIIQISLILMSFLYTAFQKSGRNLLTKILKLSGRRLTLITSSRIMTLQLLLAATAFSARPAWQAEIENVIAQIPSPLAFLLLILLFVVPGVRWTLPCPFLSPPLIRR